MIYKIDNHLHTDFSSDSSMKLKDLIDKAGSNGYKEISITEHFDLLSSEVAEYGVPSLINYYKFADKMRSSSKVKINIGLELGELHRVGNFVDDILKHCQPEIKIGSIHVLSNGKNISIPFKEAMTDEEIEDYYLENLRLVEYGKFDILGHLGIFKRYYEENINEEKFYPIIDKILKITIEKNIALEVNYSGLRKSLRSVIPTENIISRYLNLGGELISLGSDSHTINDFDDYYMKAIEILKNLGVKNIVAKNGEEWEKHQI